MKIVAFGEVMMRLMCEQYKLLNQSDVFHAQYTGTGVNICSGLSQMGQDCYIATTLPDNHVGKAAAGALRKLGIHDDFISYKGNHIGIYFLEQGIGNRASYVTYLNRKDSAFGLSNVADYDIDALLCGMDALHICGIALAMSEHSRQCALAFAKAAKQKGIKVLFDCNYRPSLWEGSEQDPHRIYQEMASLSDVLFASEKDAEQLGIAVNRDPESILADIRQTFGVDVVFGTKRNDDTYCGYLVDQHGYVESKRYPLTIYDRIGGGDAFAAGAIYGYFHLRDRLDRIDFATVAGVLGHTTYGDSFVLTLSDIERFRKFGPEDIIR